MGHIAVIICNWNKKEDVLLCIQSVLDSTHQYIDLYVVDNASTDGSAEAIKRQYGRKVTLIENKENLGGAKGFNTGIRFAMKQQDYEYLHLLDNDVLIKDDAIEQLYHFMERHQDVGAAGSKLYVHGTQHQLQELGADIDWSGFSIAPKYKGHMDDDGIPDLVDCDYVPACSVMVRTKVLQKTGLMDEGCFIYWDDIDWFHRFKTTGYRVVAYSGSQVFHKMGAVNRQTTFATYYFWRNRIHFFVKHGDNAQLVRFSKQLFREAFQAVYFSIYKKECSSARTILAAMADAFESIRGQAPEGRVLEREEGTSPLESLIKKYNQIVLFDSADLQTIRKVIQNIFKINPKIELVLVAERHSFETLSAQFRDLQVIPVHSADDLEGLRIQACEHIKDIQPNSLIDCYVDGYSNTVITAKDRRRIASYQRIYERFKGKYQPIIEEHVFCLREMESRHESTSS